MTAEEPAPAKVNLFLHVGPLEADGYHPLASWVVFADAGDRLTLEPADAWTFRVEGPFAHEIGPGENLVERAARLLFARAEQPLPSVKLTLHKHLPVASGVGGGSSDAGAALRLLSRAFPEAAADGAGAEIALEIGADGPVCFSAVPALMQGRGQWLSPAPETPPLPVVLINPRRACPTGAVYRAYDEGPQADAAMPDLPARFYSVEAVVEALAATRNDLEAPAVSLEPGVAEALALARSAPETLLARMSGSGATVFVLCRSESGAKALALRLSGSRPEWWTAVGRLSPEITNP